MSQPRRSLGRLLGEFMVIVVGVLVALAVDRWTQGVDESRAEQEYLERLEADLMTDSATVSAHRAMSESAVDNLLVLEDLWERRHLLSADSVIGVVLAGGTAGDEPSAVLATFEELKATGGLRLIAAPRVRAALLEYHQFAAEQRTRLETSRSRGREPYFEVLWEIGAFSPVVPPSSELLSRLEAIEDFEVIRIRAATYQGIRADLILPEWLDGISEALEVVRAAG